MQSRISYFDPTVFKKNLTRFAPVWGLYTVCLFMGLFVMMDSGMSYWFHTNIANCIQVMAVVNLGYALICAQLLFGDLYNARMCNMLHALPLRREGWFVTHVVSGLAFSFGPTLSMTLAALAMTPFSDMVNGWQIPLYWLLGVNLEFIFFFGVAAFSALCVGSRFAQAVVYGILNAASVLVYFLVDTLYTPMFYGLRTREDPFLWFTPVAKMADQLYIDCDQMEIFLGYTPEGFEQYQYYGEFTLTGNWWYLFVCAAIGLAFLAIALKLYQKRKLEVAGDFIAFRPLEPVFLVVYTMTLGTCFQFFINNLMGYGEGILFLFIGLLLGWFTGKMLLERQVKVFTKKSFLGCGALMGVFLLSLGLTYLDPLGIESWMPKAGNVESVTVGTGHGTYHQSQITLTEAGDIEKILAIHQSAIEKRIDETSWETVEAASAVEVTNTAVISEYTTEYVTYKEQVPITLVYHLKGGGTKTRYYYVYAEDPEGQTLNGYFSAPEAVFGIPEEELIGEYLDEVSQYMYFSVYGAFEELDAFIHDLSRAEKKELLNAILADCREGTMTQHYSFQRSNYDVFTIYFDTLPSANNGYTGREILIRVNNRHVMQWLEAYGIDAEAALKEYYGEDYGKY